MADAVVGFLLENLKNTLTETINLEDVKAEVEELSEFLDHCRVLLGDLEAGKAKGEIIRHWAREIKTITYGIGDVLEYYNITVENYVKGVGIGKTFQRLVGWPVYASAVRQVKLEIDKMNRRLKDLTDGLIRYNVVRNKLIDVQEYSRPPILSTSEGKLWLEKMNIPVPIEDFVGMEKDIKTLVHLLVNDGGNTPFVSLFGMRGSGKTALASKIFNHSDVQGHFEGFAWVQLNQTFQINTVFLDILKQLPSGESTDEAAVYQIDEMELAQKLYKVQKAKKCLVVLDDIRSSDAWEILRIAFPFTVGTSKIMLTTRIREVVESVNGLGYIHIMKPLSEEEGWKLFQRRAFITAFPVFQVIGKGLVRKCRGNPLAINMLGVLMASKETLKEWEMVEQYIDSHLNNGEIAIIPQVLASTLIDLLSHLEPYFLYLGYFPEESEIELEKLSLLWSIEGIVAAEGHGRGMERFTMDRAEDYMKELHQRGLVKVKEEVTNLRRSKSCHIDGLMRELCLSKAKEEEFVEVIDFGPGSKGTRDSFSFDSTNPLRRLVIYLDKHNHSFPVPFVCEAAKFLRFLFVYNAHEHKNGSVLPKEIWDLRHFRVLRVLVFDGVDFRLMELPRGIFKLVLLRYLSFKGCFLKVLPKAICRLSHLEILDLQVRNEITIPNFLWKIRGLRYLYLPQNFQTDNGKLRLDNLIELERLKHFSTKMCNVRHLQKLTNLQYLAVNAEANTKDLKDLIDRMNMTMDRVLSSSIDIRNFDCYTEERHSVFRQLLGCNALHTFSMEGQIRQIPSFNKISKGLTEIVLTGSGLKEDPMLAFGQLPNLQVLVLIDDAFIGGNIVCAASSFQELRWLELSNLCYLKNWWIEKGALAKLSTLTFESCRSMEAVHGLEFVTNLEKLSIRKMPNTFSTNGTGVR